MSSEAHSDPVSGSPDRAELGRRAASGAVWNYGGFAWTKLATLITTVLLARLMTPAEFGVVALALVIVGYLDIVNSFGITAAVIYEPDEDQRSMSVAFWLSQLTGFAAFLVTALTAPLTARLFHMPELAPIQIVLGFGFVLISLGSVHDARLRRQLAWRRRVPADIARSTTKAVVAVLLALGGLGAWSLVWSQLAASLVFSLGVIVALRWWPSLVWDRSIVRRQMNYGGQVTLISLGAAIVRDMDYLFIGAVLGSEALGYYSMGFRLPDLAIMGITWAVSQTVFPVFAQLRMDQAGLAGGVVRVQRMLAIATLPIATALWVASDQIVRVMYGPGWGPTAQVVPFIAAYSVLHSFAFVGGDALKAIGRVDVLTKVVAIRLPITAAALWLVVPHGIVAVAVTQLGIMAVNFGVQLLITRTLIGPSLRSMLGALVPAAAGALGLAASFLIVETAGWSPLITLALGLGLGLAVYVGIVSRLERDGIRELRALLTRRPAGLPS